MGVQGLADGFLAGFQTMDGYYRGKKADERADKELGLRDLQVHQGIEDSNRNFDLRKKGFDYGVEKDKRDFDYTKSQDVIKNAQQDKYIAISQGNLGLAQSRDKRDAAEHAYRMEEANRKTWNSNNLPILNIGLQKAANGEDPGQAYWDVLNSPEGKKYGSAYNLNTYNQEYLNAGKRLLGFANGIVNGDVKPDLTNEEGIKAFTQQVNTPQNVADMNVLYRDLISEGTGQFDPAIGKTITKKEFDHFVIGNSDPTDAIPDGKIGLGLKVTYDDGTTAFKPVTEGRGTDKNDLVKLMDFQTIIGDAGSRTKFAHSVQGVIPQIQQATGMTEGFDANGYKSAMTTAESEATKALAKVYAAENVPKEEKDAAAAQIRARLQESQASIGRLYGAPSNAGSSGNSGSDPLSDWVAHDPVKKAWAMNVGNRDALMQMINSGGIDAAYQDDIKSGWRPNATGAAAPAGKGGVTPKKPGLIDLITGVNQAPKEFDEYGEPVSPY